MFLSPFSLVDVEPARSDKVHQNDHIRRQKLAKDQGDMCEDPVLRKDDISAAGGGRFQMSGLECSCYTSERSCR